ncbi:hypothetical protein E2C01_038888 [Portunus trituberculatus]|uniref:Uncharacterized protein n=1 Tax=Portunus trituberculatus TaxID=210409 RepID=A0A5B7FJQ8_PORTR|nr:hypothetical protein [Portunus trituberculatus]
MTERQNKRSERSITSLSRRKKSNGPAIPQRTIHRTVCISNLQEKLLNYPEDRHNRVQRKGIQILKRSKSGHTLPGSCPKNGRNTLNLLEQGTRCHCSNFICLHSNEVCPQTHQHVHTV